MDLLITICARGGSKGIPGKNIRMLNGKPLIAYSIEIAKRFSETYPSQLALSTDSLEIKSCAQSLGLSTSYVRPTHLGSDTAGKIDTIRDVLLYSEKELNIKFEYVLDLDVTSPLRTMDDLKLAFQMLKADKDAQTLFSVSPANRNPYFNMVERRPDGYVDLVKKSSLIKTRQQAPPVYDVNASFYFYRRSFFDGSWQTALTESTLVYVVPHLCFDLDHPHDFTILELLLRENLLDFNL